jgi:hypothetical protein
MTWSALRPEGQAKATTGVLLIGRQLKILAVKNPRSKLNAVKIHLVLLWDRNPIYAALI